MRLHFSGHAVKRMFERQIGVAQVASVLDTGEVIEERPDDYPHPSRLILGYAAGRPLHVLLSEDTAGGVRTVVTLYEPNRSLWSDDFKRRRRP
jgi:hypothetical protein